MLKKILQRDEKILLVGANSPIEAMFLKSAGFKAAYLSGAAYSNEMGMLDEGNISLKTMERKVKEISRAADIPLVVDCDTGLMGRKKTKNDLEEDDALVKMVLRLEKAEAAAIQIEDQVPSKKRCGHLPGKEIIDVNKMFWKIRIAKLKSRNMLIIARTDARAPEGLDAAIWRSHRYINAGADIIFPEALESLDEFKIFRREVPRIPLMANLTTHGKTPNDVNAKKLFDIGYQIVLFPVLLRILLKKYEEILKDIKWFGSLRGFVARGESFSRNELNDFIKRNSKLYAK